MVLFVEANGVLYTGGGLLSQFAQVSLAMMSVYYAIVVNSKYHVPLYIKGLNMLVLMFTIYGIVLLLSGQELYINTVAVHSKVGRFEYLKNIFNTYLPIYPFFFFTKEGKLTKQVFKRILIILFVLAILSYFANERTVLEARGELGEKIEITNNMAYTFVGLLPALVIFVKKPKLLLMCLLICSYYIIMGMKRGAIISGVICIVWFILNIVKESGNRRKWQYYVLMGVILMAFILMFRYMSSTSDYFNSRLEQTLEGNSSERDVYYLMIWNYFLDKNNFINLLIGNGAYATISIFGIAAHNDWLEIAICHGILGLIIYLRYWFYLLQTWLRAKSSDAYMALGMIFIIYFMRTIFSMSGITTASAMAIGYFLVEYQKYASSLKNTINKKCDIAS